jgi:hypothetical protein
LRTISPAIAGAAATDSKTTSKEVDLNPMNAR